MVGAVTSPIRSASGPTSTGPRLVIEHPTGTTPVEAEVDATVTPPRLIRSGVVRTARKLFDGTVYPRESALPA